MLRVEYALTTDRTMKALTGLTRSAFHALVPAFDQALYEKALHRNPPRQRRPGGGGPAKLKTTEAKLFFILTRGVEQNSDAGHRPMAAVAVAYIVGADGGGYVG